MSLVSELATCPASKHASPIDRHNVDRPEQRRPHRDRLGRPRLPQRHARFAPTNAMECTVLRVPCIPSSRRRAFLRSSVRRRGPPPSNPSLAFGERLPPCSPRIANEALDPSYLLLPVRIALRVARLIARTRSGLCLAVRSAAARREASPRAGITADTPVRPLVTISSLRSWPKRNRSQWDVSTAFQDVSNVPNRPKSSLE